MFYNLPSVVEVRQKGFMVGIELKGRLEDRVGAKVCQRCAQIRGYFKAVGQCDRAHAAFKHIHRGIRLSVDGNI